MRSAAPTIVQPPTSHVILAEESNLTVTCRAVGTPVPLVSWMFNWKSFSSRPRVKTTSVNGLGTLEISQVQPSDAGFWTCQAMNKVNHKLAPFDLELVVKCWFYYWMNLNLAQFSLRSILNDKYL